MRIKAIQKTSLIDYPGKIACIIFCFGCNFKCGFCHNPELVIKEETKDIQEQDILSFLKNRRKYIDGVCITGGEPLLDINIDFLRRIKEIGYDIKIDTNGSFPEKLNDIINEGVVDYIAMDIKASKEKYSEVICSAIDLNKIEQSIKIISGFPNYEFRTTILRKYHNEIEMKKIAEWLKKITGKQKLKKFAIQGFKNNQKFIDMQFEKEPEPTKHELDKLKQTIEGDFEQVEVRF